MSDPNHLKAPDHARLNKTLTAGSSGAGSFGALTRNFALALSLVTGAPGCFGEEAPAEQPPAEQPPAEQPPAEQPPAEAPAETLDTSGLFNGTFQIPMGQEVSGWFKMEASPRDLNGDGVINETERGAKDPSPRGEITITSKNGGWALVAYFNDKGSPDFSRPARITYLASGITYYCQAGTGRWSFPDGTPTNVLDGSMEVGFNWVP